MIRKVTKSEYVARTGLLLALLLASGAARGQCTSCTTLLSGNGTVTPDVNTTVCIAAGTTYSGQLNISNSGVTVCNSGTFAGTINYNSNNSGLVINNLGLFSPNTVTLSSPATLNNGSSDGGATVVASASWEGYFGNTIGVAPVINNYASWKSQIQPLPGGTITNASGATWNAYLTTSANLAITNAGTWSSQIQEGGNSPTINIIHNGGSWSGGVGGGSGSLRITNRATWTQGFNFPGGGSNAFTTASGATTTLSGYLGLSGMVVLSNSGTMSLTGGMAALGASSSLLTTAGSTFTITGDFTNQGTVANAGALSSTGNFTNSGTITGTPARPSGTIRAGGYTVNNSSFGADGSYLDFCDGTPPSPASNGFDVRGGTVGSNVTFCAAAPLPVTLTSFGAQLRPGQVVVQWATATELNSKQFVLERSADGVAFEALQTVAGAGTSTTPRTYAATDAAPLPGLSYYRLRQVDHDGTSTYSPVASVRRAAASFGAYPNPTPGALTLDLRALPAGACTLRLLSLPGQVLLTQPLAGGAPQPLSLAHLPAGTYLLELTSAGPGRSVQRIVKR